MVDPSHAAGVRLLRVPDGPGGRVDRYLADATGLSRSYVQKLISDGRLTSAGAALRANAIVGAGTELRLEVPEPTVLDMIPAPEIPLDVVYEDDDLLIIDKPAGLVVHPAPGHATGRWSTHSWPTAVGRPGAGSPASSDRASSTASTATRAAF